MLLANAPEKLKEIIANFGKSFLGEEAVLEEVEPIKSGVSYNYKVTFSGQKYIVKVDNPAANVAMQASGKAMSDTASRAQNFNLVAKTINFKINNHNLRAPHFIAAQNGFCIIADDAQIADLPPEFQGKIVSMQRMVNVLEPAAKNPDAINRDLAMQMGRLHRPAALVNEFEHPEMSGMQNASAKNRQNVEVFFGTTAVERQEKLALAAQNIEAFIASTKDSRPAFHQQISRLFLDGKCDIALMTQIIEEACKEKPLQTLPQTQISHNDLHRGNTIIDGAKVTLIDFDDIGISEVTKDLFIQFAIVLDAYNYNQEKFPQNLQLNHQAIENFVTAYIAYNPYFNKEEFKAVTNYAISMTTNLSCQTLLDVALLAQKWQENKIDPQKLAPIEEDFSKINTWDKMFKIFKQQVDNQSQLREAFAKIYESAFDKSQSKTVEALVDLRVAESDRDVSRAVEGLDLARDSSADKFFKKAPGQLHFEDGLKKLKQGKSECQAAFSAAQENGFDVKKALQENQESLMESKKGLREFQKIIVDTIYSRFCDEKSANQGAQRR